MDSPPVILGGPQVTGASLDLLALSYRDNRVTHWETYNHAKSRGVTVDRASGVEVMGHKQPVDALWGFTVYPVAVATKPAPKPASFDAVIMNPPFRKVREHIKTALGLLKDGGALVALVPVTFQGGDEIMRLDADTFSAAKVHTKIIKIVKGEN
jgi:hypothetical protein